jgi:adenylate cyclase
MASVRGKLLGIALVSVAPALLAVVLRAKSAEQQLLDEARSRLDAADDAFLFDFSKTAANSDLALRLLANAQSLRDAVREGNRTRAAGLLEQLSKAYPLGVVVLRLPEGGPVAELAGRHYALPPDFLPIVEAETSTGPNLFSVAGKGYVNVQSQEVEGESRAALILVTPADAAYFSRVKAQLGHEWALRVNGRLVAMTPGHSELLAEIRPSDGVAILERGGRTFAVNAFHPWGMHGQGEDALVVASTDITSLRQEIRSGLAWSLVILGIALVLALGLALRIARNIANGILAISKSAMELQRGRYQTVKGVHTGDELEALAHAFNSTVVGLHERDRLKETLGKYVSREIAERILQKSDLGGEAVQVTVLFSDIRSFTSFSEQMDPKGVLDFLNTYFHDMVESVLQHQGVVDKFIGDAVMAVYGAPDPAPDDALRAVRTALDMRRRLEGLNQRFRVGGLPEIRIGIGVHTGRVVAGNIGHEERREYTVIGDAVNLAARLESMTKELSVDILISEDTYQAVAGHVEAEALKKTQIKGRRQEVMVYRLIAIKENARSEQLERGSSAA